MYTLISYKCDTEELNMNYKMTDMLTDLSIALCNLRLTSRQHQVSLGCHCHLECQQVCNI